MCLRIDDEALVIEIDDDASACDGYGLAADIRLRSRPFAAFESGEDVVIATIPAEPFATIFHRIRDRNILQLCKGPAA